MITRFGMLVTVLFSVSVGTSSAFGVAGGGVPRRQVLLRDGWLVKQLDSDKPDIAALMRESATPDKSWLAARMPAQMHEILLEHGLIADPHVGKNAAACA
jgi:hypothetical protein